MTKPITVLIVDDSNLIRTLFREMLSDVPDIQVLDTAEDALDAREKIKKLSPDVLTLDIEMPKLDGLSFLEKIMSLRPMPVLMVSTLTQRGASETLRALEIGAVDYISKPTGENAEQGLKNLKQELIEKIRVAAKANVKQRHAQKPVEKSQALAYQPPHHPLYSLIAMGSSTGGVEALREIFLRLPGNLPPIVITQHMPKQFTSSMAARLDSLSQVTITEAAQGTLLKPGHAYIAPGDQHMRIIRAGGQLVCHLSAEDPVSGHRPSVDVLFSSVAEIGGDALGVILTGMGKDGAAGMRQMRDAGCYTIGQSEATCVVYGMPKAAMLAGGVHSELPLLDIPATIISSCEQERKAAHG